MESIERQRRADRRARPTPVISRYWLRGQRRAARRIDEMENIYVDRYTPAELALVAGVLILSVLDMVFTINHLNAGGTEANPAMAWVLDLGGHALFMGVKLVRYAFLLYAGIFVFHIYLGFLRSTGGGL